jgi:hypothetical protein
MPGGFLFKHIIGKEFRKKYCNTRNYTCSMCPSNADCVYGLTLEPTVTKINPALMGKDKVTLPVIMETSPFVPKEARKVVLSMTFIGNAIQYIPYFYSALRTREDLPLFKTKAMYTVKDLTDGKKTLLRNGDIDMNIPDKVWEYVPGMSEPVARKLLIQIQTLFRFRGSRRYTDDFSTKNFMNCLHKRIQSLATQHGINDYERAYEISGNMIDITERDHIWIDLDHYSTRQRKVIKLGGNTGSFSIEGVFTEYEMAMLHFAEIFHAGEQTSSGLGRLLIKEKR